jgi:endonuclease/exonuclease/phosphatase family metal-dependent hydrolase
MKSIVPKSLEYPDALHMISFNAWALPVWIPNAEQIKRYKAIPGKLLEQNADIICVQEAFARKFRKRLLPALEDTYNTFSDYYCNQSIAGPVMKDCHGGLITFSKFPILEETFYPYPVYDAMRIEERIGEKGFLITTIASPKGVINVINTHLYAGSKSPDEKHRSVQISFMDSIINIRKDLDQYPLFLLGDLNVTHPDIADVTNQERSIVYDRIINQMKFDDSAKKLNADYYTIDKSRNNYSGSNNGKEKLDYCLFRLCEGKTIICKDQSILFDGREAISDHLAWRAVYDIGETNALSQTSDKNIPINSIVER